MPRPKGSKNKAKPAATPPPAAPVVTEQSHKPVGHSLHVVEEWQPAPEMGGIKAPSKDVSLCECGDQRRAHYGPDIDWCNRAGCQCQTFEPKK